jgi:hypothetical protein
MLLNEGLGTFVERGGERGVERGGWRGAVVSQDDDASEVASGWVSAAAMNFCVLKIHLF